MTYTHGHHESVLRSHKWRTVDNSAAYLAPHLTSGTRVLDLGCGPGAITADIGRRVRPGRVLGIDSPYGRSPATKAVRPPSNPSMVGRLPTLGGYLPW